MYAHRRLAVVRGLSISMLYAGSFSFAVLIAPCYPAYIYCILRLPPDGSAVNINTQMIEVAHGGEAPNYMLL